MSKIISVMASEDYSGFYYVAYVQKDGRESTKEYYYRLPSTVLKFMESATTVVKYHGFFWFLKDLMKYDGCYIPIDANLLKQVSEMEIIEDAKGFVNEYFVSCEKEKARLDERINALARK